MSNSIDELTLSSLKSLSKYGKQLQCQKKIHEFATFMCREQSIFLYFILCLESNLSFLVSIFLHR
jgi:hypothetical protein